MLFCLLLTGLLALLGYYIYVKGSANKEFFTSQGVKSLVPRFIAGNSAALLFQKVDMYTYMKQLYSNFPAEKAFGMYDMTLPVMVIKDTTLLKQITVKEFDHFADHRIFIDEKMDSLFGNSLVSLTGQKWRDMRSTLSPAFTGSKMRLMFQLIVDVSEQMVVHMKKEASAKGILECEMKNMCSKFTNDIIALCAFGYKTNTLENDQNEFYKAGKDIMNFSKPSRLWKFFGFRFFPKLMQFFKIQLFQDVHMFFKNIIINTMDYREKNSVFRPDMINLLMEMRKGTLTHNEPETESDSAGFATVTESDVGKKAHKRMWNDDEIIAQCFLFFLAGFDTSSTMMSFAVYEMALEQSIQDKLYEEVREVNDKLEGKPLTYEILQRMKYLDMVTSETLRKCPPAPVTDRICVKDLDFDDGEGFKFNFTKKTGIWIPIYGLHHDPKYFPNPEKFDPERFSDENKHLINLDAYVPFGVGPRNCIGSRFALMEVKALLYYIILNFSLIVIEKTQVPLKLRKGFGAIISDDGIWVGLKPRN